METDLIEVAEFCDKWGGKAKGALVPYTAAAYVIAKYGGVSKARAYFSEKLGFKMSKHPVEKLLSDIRHGRIILTREEILAEASRHPHAEAYFARNPSALDPFSEDEEEGAEEPTHRPLPKNWGAINRTTSAGGTPRALATQIEASQPMAQNGSIAEEEARRQAQFRDKLLKKK